MAKMICPNCNKEVDVNATKCPHCGFSFAGLQKQEEKRGHGSSQNNNKSVRPGSVLAWTGGIILVLVLVAFGSLVLPQLGDIFGSNDKVEHKKEADQFADDDYIDDNYFVEEVIEEVSSEEAWKFLRSMYDDVKYQDEQFIQSHCSADVLQKLKDDYDYEGDGYACWDFRSGHQDGYEDTHMLVNVSDCGDGWFVYQGIDMGWLFDRSVRLIKKDGVIIIDSLYLGDIRNYGKDDVPSERENGVIPDSLVYSPGVDEQEFLDLLFPDRKNDEYAVFEIQKNLIASDHSRQILSIYINDGIHECYSVYAIDLNEREYTRFGTFDSVRFNNTEFTGVTGYDTMINEEGDLGYLRTENVYGYDGSLLRSVSNLYTDEY